MIAPDFAADALEILTSQKEPHSAAQKPVALPEKLFKTLLNGVIEQDKDLKTETEADFKVVTERQATDAEKMRRWYLPAKVCKHTKSNTIVLAKENRLISQRRRPNLPGRCPEPGH